MRIVLAHGVFDVLHVGHHRLLREARSLGDALFVSVLGDEAVRMHKGLGRPINSQDVRREQLLDLRFVDDVLVVQGPLVADVEEMIAALSPAVYVKGIECRGRVPEEGFCRARGIDMHFVDMARVSGEVISTTRCLRELA